MKLTYAFLLIFSVMLSSCVDDSTFADEVKKSPNIIGFELRNTNISGIANGSEYENLFNVEVVGPSTAGLSGEFTATVTVDPTSTAIEGTHFRIDNPTITVTSEGKLRNVMGITMLTEGIVAPLASNPVLVLNVTNATGSGVIASGAQLSVNLLYLCNSVLEGQYEVTITRDDGAVYVYPDYITETGVGQYRGESVGRWSPGSIGGTPGFDFVDVCNVITVPEQNLVDLYSNLVGQDGKPEDSFVDPATGIITIKYYVTFAAGDSYFTAVYVPQ